MISLQFRLNATITKLAVYLPPGPYDIASESFQRALIRAIAGDLDASRATRSADPWDAISVDDSGRIIIVGRLRELSNLSRAEARAIGQRYATLA